MKIITTAAVALMLGVAACGDDSDASTPTTDTPVPPEQWQAGRYTNDYQVCELIGKSARGELDHEFIDDSGITVDPVTNPRGYAQAWAEQYRPEFQQSSFEGCLDGLEGNPPREPLP